MSTEVVQIIVARGTSHKAAANRSRPRGPWIRRRREAKVHVRVRLKSLCICWRIRDIRTQWSSSGYHKIDDGPRCFEDV